MEKQQAVDGWHFHQYSFHTSQVQVHIFSLRPLTIGGYRIYGLSILSHETGHDLRERTTNIHLSPTDYVTEYHFVCKEKKTEKVLKQIAINYFQYYYQLTHAVSEVA